MDFDIAHHILPYDIYINTLIKADPLIGINTRICF